MIYQLVIDTNVFLSALKSSRGASYKLITLIGTGKFDLNISIPLVAEYEETLRREIHHISENAIADILSIFVWLPKGIKFFICGGPF